MRRDFSTVVVILTIVVLVVLYFYAGYARGKAEEVRAVAIEDFTVSLPPGFRPLTKLERQSYGFPKRVEVLKKGDFEELLLVDVETGLPEHVERVDLAEYLELAKEYLADTISDFELTDARTNQKESSYSIVYTGKGREGPFVAVLYSRVYPGAKVNVTISGPEGSRAALEAELAGVRVTRKR